MSIASEIERIQNAKSSIKTAIENKGVEVGNGTIDTYASKINEITSGDVNIMDLFPYTQSVVFDNDISDITEDITLHLERATTLYTIFDQKNINCSKITIYISNTCTNARRSFRGTNNDEVFKEVELIGDTSGLNDVRDMFLYRKSLERIIGQFDFRNITATSGMFNNCSSLKEFTPVANTIKTTINFGNSSLLTDTTIQSIIDGLADLTGATAQTLTFHADVKANLSDEQIASITSKNWTLA